MDGLRGRRAVVTASGGKMGAAIAARLAREGADVVVNDLVAELTAATAAVVRGHGGRALEVVADASTPEGAAAVVGAALDEWGGVDLLINNLGSIAGPYTHELDEIGVAEWDATMAVNTRSTFLCTKLAVPGMKERRWGKIVNIASTAWSGGVSPYSTSKAAVVAFTRGLAVELGPHNINVNAVAPGATLTKFQPPPEMAETIPLRRFNEPDDIAGAVAFLVSEDARNVSGQLLTVSGGLNPSL
jgi:NAD(P)-dependent dehydrogenase (short-subunit alcohol dehydrogenase family)